MRHFLVVLVSTGLLVACGSSESGGGDSVDAGGAAQPDGSVVGQIDGGGAADIDGGGGAAIDAGPSGVEFTRHVLDSEAAGPAYVSVADFDDNGTLDILVSHFGVAGGFSIPNGQVTLYRRTGGLGQWDKQVIVGDDDGIKFPGQTTVADIDGDGDLDFLLPSGFLACTAIPFGGACGGLGWYEQSDDGWERHDIVEVGSSLFFHLAVLVDIDGDGRDDLLTTGEEMGGMMGGTSQAVTMWFQGENDERRFSPNPLEIGASGGSMPRVIDVDGDDDLDIASAEYFVGDSFAWFERTAEPSSNNNAGSWVRHVIADDVGPSIMLTFVDNLYGDGVRRAIGANHTNTAKASPDPWESAVYVFDIPADPKQPWPKQQISSGIVSVPGSDFAPMGAPGIFGTGDIDDDGDIDVVVSGDGDPNVYFLEQTSAGVFASHVLQSELSQAGGVTVVDLDASGSHETIVTGYEANVVYIFEHD